jgi:hypothetical protein
VTERHPFLALILFVFWSVRYTIGAFSIDIAPGQSGRQPQEMPGDAAEVQEQIAKVERQLPQLPDKGAALYFLAASKQHLGATPEALLLLEKCVLLHEGFDPAGSPELGILKGNRKFDELVDTVHREFPAVDHSRLAYVTTEKDLVPEGFAYDSKHRVFYLSSLNRRKIVKITLDGAVSDFVPAGQGNLLPVLGIRPSPADGTVWADSWDEDSGRSELLHFNSSGRLLHRYTPADSVKHGFNDLVLGKRGEVFLTDSLANQVFRFDPVSELFYPLETHRPLSAPNGIALMDSGRYLYIADDFGVVMKDLQNSASLDVNAGPHNTLAGIDGLYWLNNTLVAVQNAIGTPRIASFQLSEDGTRVTRTTVLENRPSFTFLPTTGAIMGGNFYFIMNSQVDNMNGDHVIDVSKLEAVRIGVLPLPVFSHPDGKP